MSTTETDQRVQIAERMDRAAHEFLAAMDEMNEFGEERAADVHGAAREKTASRESISATVMHAKAFGPAMSHALAVFLGHILHRVENSGGIAVIAPGWAFNETTVKPFAEAAEETERAIAYRLR